MQTDNTDSEIEESSGIMVIDHLVITDLDTDEILIAQRGSIKNIIIEDDE